jgi:hypothetical protein
MTIEPLLISNQRSGHSHFRIDETKVVQSREGRQVMLVLRAVREESTQVSNKKIVASSRHRQKTECARSYAAATSSVGRSLCNGSLSCPRRSTYETIVST